MQVPFVKLLAELTFPVEDAEALWTDMVGEEPDSQVDGISLAQWESTLGSLYVAIVSGIVTASVEPTSKTLARIEPLDLIASLGQPAITRTGLQRFLCKVWLSNVEGWITVYSGERSCLKIVPGVSLSFGSDHLESSGDADAASEPDGQADTATSSVVASSPTGSKKNGHADSPIEEGLWPQMQIKKKLPISLQKIDLG